MVTLSSAMAVLAVATPRDSLAMDYIGKGKSIKYMIVLLVRLGSYQQCISRNLENMCVLIDVSKSRIYIYIYIYIITDT